jgi:hypothetical protein
MVAGDFSTDDKLNNCGLYIYNKNSNAPVMVDEIKIERKDK